MSKKLKQKKGFTIIEVVLVLAIAGLIFLMVFVVVPTAMAGQRDGERRNAMSRVQEGLIAYQTNNKSKRNNLPAAGTFEAPEDGTYPETCDSACSFVKNYMNIGGEADVNKFDDPDGVPYNVVITDNMTKADISGTSFTPTGDDGGNVVSKFVSEEVELDTGETVTGYTIGGENEFKAHVVYIVPGGQCAGEYVIKSELRHFAVLYRLEGSGVYCGGSD